ncbi:unnamed protein product, partial [Musa textilis]
RSTGRGWRQGLLQKTLHTAWERLSKTTDRIASELAAADKKKIEDAIQQDIHLLDVNQSEEAGEFATRSWSSSASAKTYQGVGVDMAGRMGDDAPSAGGSGAGSPIEEVDRARLSCFQEVVPRLVDMYVL